MTSNLFPTGGPDFQALQNSIAAQVDVNARLPRWQFRGALGCATIFEYDRILGSGAGNVLAELADTHHDDTITAVGIEPLPTHYHLEHGLFPAFRIEGDNARTTYGESAERAAAAARGLAGAVWVRLHEQGDRRGRRLHGV